MGTLKVRDVRATMPNYGAYCDVRREGDVTGIAIHHSATANVVTGVSMDDAATIFRHHVETLGWSHGGYHYLVHPTGLVEYALDEATPAFHAGFRDPGDLLRLECGQYWNNHLIAVCLLGWFEPERMPVGAAAPIPNRFTSPTRGQWTALLGLLRDLMGRHAISAEFVRGHRELVGARTRCPGENVDLDALRAALRGSEDGPT